MSHICEVMISLVAVYYTFTFKFCKTQGYANEPTGNDSKKINLIFSIHTMYSKSVRKKIDTVLYMHFTINKITICRELICVYAAQELLHKGQTKVHCRFCFSK